MRALVLLAAVFALLLLLRPPATGGRAVVVVPRKPPAMPGTFAGTPSRRDAAWRAVGALDGLLTGVSG